MTHAKHFLVGLLAATLTAGCEGPRGEPGPPGGVDPDASPLDKALAALGGARALADLAAFRLEASGERYLTLEGNHPDDDAHLASTFAVVVTHDVTDDRLRIDYQRNVPLFGADLEASLVVDGELGAVVGVESAFGFPGGAMGSDRWAATRRNHRLLHPQLVLRDLAAGRLTASDGGLALIGGSPHHRLVVADPIHPLTLHVDVRTGQLTSLATLENDFVSGDVEIEAFYLGWRDWGGDLRLPAEVLIAQGGALIHAERRVAIALDPVLDADHFAFPADVAPTFVAADADRGARHVQFHEGFAALGLPLDGEQTFVAPTELAPGVFLLAGGSHNSLAVVQQGGIVLVEAPLYEARAQAILAWAAEAFPGTPVSHVIATHHHRDHVGALRTLVARGATVVVGAPAAPFFAGAFRAARTIEPDELAAAPRTATIRAVPVGGSLTLADPVRPVAVHHIATRHAADMVAVYLPEHELLFDSDLFSPGLPPFPTEAGELLDAVEALGLEITTIAGGHGGVGTLADLAAAAGR
jgi:glyoxylase-like metal-dependent hydrolase (beta-lactamase superfamily II)